MSERGITTQNGTYCKLMYTSVTTSIPVIVPVGLQRRETVETGQEGILADEGLHSESELTLRR